MAKIDVKKVAKLANLKITPEEEHTYSDQLSKILNYVELIETGADTAKVDPTYNVSSNSTVLADDQLSESLSQEEALKNASSEKDGFFMTKGVFENE